MIDTVVDPDLEQSTGVVFTVYCWPFLLLQCSLFFIQSKQKGLRDPALDLPLRYQCSYGNFKSPKNLKGSSKNFK